MKYKRLGDFIDKVNSCNIGMISDNLLGININKFFMPSVANVVGVDLENYKIINKNQFACNLMHVGRDMRIPIALYTKENPSIISPAYVIFENIQPNLLLNEYLMMWFERAEFDRNAWFYTDADVRGGLNWDEMCNIKLPVPSIEKQREIVAEYKTITNKIKLNERISQNLSDIANAVFKSWFVDFEQFGGIKPDDWEKMTIKNFCKDIYSGGTPSRDEISYWDSNDIPWLTSTEVKNNVIIDSKEYISNSGYKSSSAKLFPCDTVVMSMYGRGTAGTIGYLKFESTTNQALCGMICNNIEDTAYLYFHLLCNQTDISNMVNGAVQENISKMLIEKLPIIKPNKDILKSLPFKVIVEHLEYLTRENKILREISNISLSKMTINED